MAKETQNQKFQRDYELTEEINAIIKEKGEKYAQKQLFANFCMEVVNSIIGDINYTFEKTKSNKQTLNDTTNKLDSEEVDVFRFTIDKITIKKRIPKEILERKKSITPNGNKTPKEKNKGVD